MSKEVDIFLCIVFIIACTASIISTVFWIHYKRILKKCDDKADIKILRGIINNLDIIMVQCLGFTGGLLIAHIIIS